MLRSLGVFGCVLSVAGPAAAEWKSPLEGQPGVRHRLELRAGRFEVGPALGFTIGQAFRHSFLAGIKAEYHLWDWFSVGGTFTGGVAAFNSSLTNELNDTNQELVRTCDAKDTADAKTVCRSRELIRSEEESNWRNALNETAWNASLRGVFTPFSGKLGLFSRLFSQYDLYFWGGVGFVGLKNSTSAALENDGVRIGPNVGSGLHFFFTPSMAVVSEFSTTWISNNPSGRNVDRSADDSAACADNNNCDRVDSEDRRTMGYYTVMFGVQFFLPWEAGRTP